MYTVFFTTPGQHEYFCYFKLVFREERGIQYKGTREGGNASPGGPDVA